MTGWALHVKDSYAAIIHHARKYRTMKAITIHPVWAWAIVHGHKRVENRTWRTRYRGPLLIHASACSTASRRSDELARAALAAIGVDVPACVPTAAIVGSVNVVDVVAAGQRQRALDRDPLATGPWCWCLEHARAFREPIPARGAQSLWDAAIAVP